jgi:hypothetical protein
MSEKYAFPKRAVMCTLECAFCCKESVHYAFCAPQLAVFACKKPEHISFAEKSKNVWLGLRKRVLFEDFCNEELFTNTNILSIDVAVKRSEKLADGTAKVDLQGWKIIKPLLPHVPVTIGFKAQKNAWVIDVLNSDEDASKSIPLEDLKMSLSEDKHVLVDTFVAKLESGVYYKEDVSAFQMHGSKYV